MFFMQHFRIIYSEIMHLYYDCLCLTCYYLRKDPLDRLSEVPVSYENMTGKKQLILNSEKIRVLLIVFSFYTAGCKEMIALAEGVLVYANQNEI